MENIKSIEFIHKDLFNELLAWPFCIEKVIWDRNNELPAQKKGPMNLIY